MDRNKIDPLVRVTKEHPAYRYPESGNPYWKKTRELVGIVFADNESEAHREKWRECFRSASTDEKSRSRPKLHVEIGCNAGHVLTAWARQNPGDRYIGIDWKFKAIFKAAQKIQKLKLENTLLLRAHAERLAYVFSPGEIDHLYLFFPDPWPKRNHWKNRFVLASRLKTIRPLLSKIGRFEIKTDHAGYFDWMCEEIEKSGVWNILEQTRDLHRSHPDPTKLDFPEVTLFEKIFVRDRLPIHRLLLGPKDLESSVI